MSTPVTIELTSLLPEGTLDRLQEEAERQQLPLSDVVRSALEEFVQQLDEDELEETSDEKIEADLRQAWADAMNGNTRPARDLLAEIRAARTFDAD